MFIAVMETGSFTSAAERRGTSSGQASKLLSRLEADLGVRLLNRTTRLVAPTEAGQAYYDRLRPLIEEFDTLDLAIRNMSGKRVARSLSTCVSSNAPNVSGAVSRSRPLGARAF